jgi:hypothetical protein
MLETVREANTIINNFRGERGVIFIRTILTQRFSRIVVAQWNLPVTVAVRSEAWVLAGWLLGSWVRIPIKAWML